MSHSMTVPARTPPIESAAEGEKLIAQVTELLSALARVVEEETALVRDGRIAQATGLGARKAELAAHYYALTERVKANSAFLIANVTEPLHELRRRHDMFRPLLQMNLTVLATAHAVSEGIIRGVAGEVSRKSAPQTYGLSGKPTTPNTARPVTLSRTL
jgi:hypothetical protein